ncbi:VWA domain-containing protein [Haloferax denitrificans]|uniref:von Willebrand factor type A domain-containing protein n=1 Tax=Haloferax denitrificans ATCC 35960 TaxID=662478 RepID=M0JDU6_9EURY|nr:VWA domain-containing protein [Haloferax denitrificans]EMA07136.1 von Willebrand factor type A domain-containing protein [Haloferax denitrificans ATCC 35960]
MAVLGSASAALAALADVAVAGTAPAAATTPLAWTVEAAGRTLGLQRPLFLVALPVAALLAWALIFRGADGTAGGRSRRLLFASRFLVVLLLVVAAAGPYTVTTRMTDGDPQVTLLVDDSDSAAVTEDVASQLAADIEDEGVPVTTSTVARGDSSPIGDAVAANLRPDGTVVLVSDGQVTSGRSLASATTLARDLNATVSAVGVEPTETEQYVTVSGPSKTSVGVENAFLAQVDGVVPDDVETATVELVVEIDGEEVARETVNTTDGVEFTRTFETTGTHRVTARIAGDDRFETNDVFRKTVRVVEPPRVLYVSRGDYPFRDYLSQLYDVETAETVPADLSSYHAVVLQDLRAEDVGNTDSLQRFVIDGGGLLTVGGRNSFENGGYDGSSLASMLPVTTGEGASQQTNLVFAIDVSGSAESGMRVQKSVALDALDQLGDENRVGIVGFNYRAYDVAPLRPLGPNRESTADLIRRLQSGGATDIAVGLDGAAQQLGDRRGTIILISDGHDRFQDAATLADQLGRDGVRVIAIGTGPSPNEQTLRAIARASGGNYLRADETDRLRILFGGSNRQYAGDGLTVVDQNDFVTAGVELTANPGSVNDVSVRSGANFLVAADDGTPAVASWRYGLGRVATVTAYAGDGTLDGLLQRPDSLLLTKTTNYVIGDPERKASGVAEVSDTRVDQPTTVVYRGGERPRGVEELSFSAVSPGVYEATVVPTETGYRDVLDTAFAVNYPVEYAGFGRSAALEAAVSDSGGTIYGPNDAAEIAASARDNAAGVQPVRDDWAVAFVAAAFLLYLTEVLARRLQVYRGRTQSEGGLI